jgi:very-short-patch-repair endonuclease
MTFPERLLWSRLRAKQQRFKFRRQQPIGDYVADFYSSEARRIIELDGRSHRDTGDADDARQAWLGQQRIHVIRFTNDQVLKDIDAVVQAIWYACRDRIEESDV